MRYGQTRRRWTDLAEKTVVSASVLLQNKKRRGTAGKDDEVLLFFFDIKSKRAKWLRARRARKSERQGKPVTTIHTVHTGTVCVSLQPPVWAGTVRYNWYGMIRHRMAVLTAQHISPYQEYEDIQDTYRTSPGLLQDIYRTDGRLMICMRRGCSLRVVEQGILSLDHTHTGWSHRVILLQPAIIIIITY